MLDYIAYILVRVLNKCFSIVPISFSLWLGRRLGSVAFFFNRKRRVIAYANLKAAFCKEASPGDLRNLTKKVYRNLVQTFIEVLNLTKMNRRYVDKYIEIVNLNRIQEASRSGRGVILLTGHFGDWELSGLTSAIIGFPISVLVREQKLRRMNELLNRLRESKGCKVIKKGPSTKNILKALYEKEIVGILSDQDAGRDGVFVDFLGRATSCHAGPMEIAKRTDSIILPNFIVRTKGPYHKVHLEEYIDFRNSKGGDDVKENLQKFANILESYVRQFPEQWLWLHKRWKSTPLRTVLVLNDGRPGHLNQSMAVANQIRRARTTQGYKLEDTKVVVIDVKFKNRFLRCLLGLCANFASWRCQGCMRCMRFCLERDSYEALMRSYAEFIVSCGSSLSPVNLFMSKENNAKNIIIMKPLTVIGGTRRFGLAIIPKHDNPARMKNVLATSIAPNLMDDERIESDGRRLAQRFHIETDGTFLGLLIGGDNPEFILTKDRISKALDQILRFCQDYNTRLLVTTSRRTSREVEEMLKERLKDNPNCNLLIIANEENLDEAVGGILYLSKALVVSGESISMVSEAINSGKKVVAFELEKRRDKITKHEIALKNLEEERYLTVSNVDNLYQSVKRAWEDRRPVRESNDRERIFQAVRRLI